MVIPVSVLGDRLLDRLRSATFAMLGLVTAVGLVLVALVLQQGWPSVFGGPLPGFPKPPADEIASAVPGGGAVSIPQSGIDTAPPRTGSASGGRGFDGSKGQQGSHQVAASAPVTSSPGPAPSETTPEVPAAPPPVVDTSPAPTPSPAVAPPSAQATDPAASAKEGDGDGDKTAAESESKKPARGKDKVAANGKGSSSKGSTTTASKPKSSGSKSKPSSAKPSPPPVDKASAESVPSKPAPPAYEPSKNESDALPVEEKGEQGAGFGYGKDK